MTSLLGRGGKNKTIWQLDNSAIESIPEKSYFATKTHVKQNGKWKMITIKK